MFRNLWGFIYEKHFAMKDQIYSYLMEKIRHKHKIIEFVIKFMEQDSVE